MKIYRTTLNEIRKLILESDKRMSTNEFIGNINAVIKEYADGFLGLPRRDLDSVHQKLDQTFGPQFTEYVMRQVPISEEDKQW